MARPRIGAYHDLILAHGQHFRDGGAQELRILRMGMDSYRTISFTSASDTVGPIGHV
jgi:hypothetical protein